MRIALSIFPLSSQTRIYGISLTVPYRFFSLFLGYFCAEEHCRPCQHLCKLFHPVVLSSWHLMTRSFSKSFDPLSPSLYSDVSIKTSYGFFFFSLVKKTVTPFLLDSAVLFLQGWNCQHIVQAQPQVHALNCPNPPAGTPEERWWFGLVGCTVGESPTRI